MLNCSCGKLKSICNSTTAERVTHTTLFTSNYSRQDLRWLRLDEVKISCLDSNLTGGQISSLGRQRSPATSCTPLLKAQLHIPAPRFGVLRAHNYSWVSLNLSSLILIQMPSKVLSKPQSHCLFYYYYYYWWPKLTIPTNVAQYRAFNSDSKRKCCLTTKARSHLLRKPWPQLLLSSCWMQNPPFSPVSVLAHTEQIDEMITLRENYPCFFLCTGGWRSQVRNQYKAKGASGREQGAGRLPFLLSCNLPTVG